MAQITSQASALGAAGVVGVRIGHTARPHTLRAAWAAPSAASAAR